MRDGMDTRNVIAADTTFLLRETGDGTGTPVLLLHGVPETSTVWRDVAPALAADGHRVLAPDLPGLGGSQYAGPYDVASVVRQVVALLDAVVPGQRVDVVGHDWGGSVALGLTGGYPDRVRRLAVANTVFRHVNLLRAPHMPFFALPGAPELLFRLGGAKVVETMLRLAWKSDVALDPVAKAEYVAAYSEPQNVSAMLGYYRAATRPRLAAALRLGPAPQGPPRVEAEEMLVLWGAADSVLPIGIGESIVKDLGARCAMVTIPGAGHYVIEEAPEVVRETLSRFLADAPT
ncbi:MAG TPA: alpha/beta hydrolase [Mycobacteriales bacterium]|nr:alpha/beta hydrolase [Mycobacteriales bacterium]